MPESHVDFLRNLEKLSTDELDQGDEIKFSKLVYESTATTPSSVVSPRLKSVSKKVKSDVLNILRDVGISADDMVGIWDIEDDKITDLEKSPESLLNSSNNEDTSFSVSIMKDFLSTDALESSHLKLSSSVDFSSTTSIDNSSPTNSYPEAESMNIHDDTTILNQASSDDHSLKTTDTTTTLLKRYNETLLQTLELLDDSSTGSSTGSFTHINETLEHYNSLVQLTKNFLEKTRDGHDDGSQPQPARDLKQINKDLSESVVTDDCVTTQCNDTHVSSHPSDVFIYNDAISTPTSIGNSNMFSNAFKHDVPKDSSEIQNSHQTLEASKESGKKQDSTNLLNANGNPDEVKSSSDNSTNVEDASSVTLTYSEESFMMLALKDQEIKSLTSQMEDAQSKIDLMQRQLQTSDKEHKESIEHMKTVVDKLQEKISSHEANETISSNGTSNADTSPIRFVQINCATNSADLNNVEANSNQSHLNDMKVVPIEASTQLTSSDSKKETLSDKSSIEDKESPNIFSQSHQVVTAYLPSTEPNNLSNSKNSQNLTPSSPDRALVNNDNTEIHIDEVTLDKYPTIELCLSNLSSELNLALDANHSTVDSSPRIVTRTLKPKPHAYPGKEDEEKLNFTKFGLHSECQEESNFITNRESNVTQHMVYLQNCGQSLSSTEELEEDRNEKKIKALEEQIRRLNEEINKNKEYHVMSEDIIAELRTEKKKDFDMLQHKVALYENQLEENEIQKKALQENFDRQQHELKHLQEEKLSKFSDELQVCEKKLYDAIQEQECSKILWENERRDYQTKIKSLDNQLKEKDNDYNEYKKTLDDLRSHYEQEINELEEKLIRYKEQESLLNETNHNKELTLRNHYENEIECLKQKIEHGEKMIRGQLEEESHKNETITSLAMKLLLKDEEIKVLQQDKNNLENNLESIVKLTYEKNEAQKALQSMKEKMRDTDQKYSLQKGQMREYSENMAKKESFLKEIEEECNDLKTKVFHFKNANNSLKQQLSLSKTAIEQARMNEAKLKSKIEELVDESVKTKVQHEMAMEQLLINNQSLIVMKEEEYMKELELIKESQEKDQNERDMFDAKFFSAVEENDRLKKNIRSLQESCKELSANLQTTLDNKERVEKFVEKYKHELNLSRSKYTELQKTLQAEASSQSIEKVKELENLLTAAKLKEQALQNQVRHLKDSSKKVITELRDKLRSIEEKDVNRVDDSMGMNREVFNTMKTELERKTRSITELETRLATNRETILGLKKQFSENPYRNKEEAYKKEIESLRQTFQQTLSDIKKARDESTNKYESEIQKLNATIASERKALEDLKTQSTSNVLPLSYDERKDTLGGKLEAVENSFSDLKLRFETLQNENILLENKNKALQAEVESSKELTNKLEIELAQSVVAAKVDDNESCLIAIRDKFSKKIELVHNELVVEQRTRSKLEMELEKLQAEFDLVSNSKQAMKNSMEVKINEVRRVISSLENSKNEMKISMESTLRKKTTKINALIRERDNLRKSVETSSKELEKARTDAAFGNAKLKAKLNMITQVLVETKMNNDELLKEVEYFRRVK